MCNALAIGPRRIWNGDSAVDIDVGPGHNAAPSGMSKAIPSRPVIGLIGGIGSGKSLVSQMLQELGCRGIDADVVGHSLLRRPEIVKALTARFGGDIVGADGAIDRGVLAERAFVDARSLASLDEVMHPPLRAELSRQIDLFRADDRTSVPIVVDAALLLETDWHELCDIVVFVDAGEDCRRRRVAESRGWTAADLARRENLQKPLDIKRQIADYIVGNNSSVSRLRQQVRLLHQRLVNPSSFLFKDVDRPL